VRTEHLLRRGNGKTGESVLTWSLPRIVTCPGHSRLCAGLCYGGRGNFRLHYHDDVLNLAASQQPEFPRRMAWEIRRRFAVLVRPHVVGDYYSAASTRSWAQIARACPEVKFWSYTRMVRCHLRTAVPILQVPGLPRPHAPRGR
jgi:Gene product 88